MAIDVLSRWRVRGIVTVLCGFLIHCTLSTTYIFGSMNPYITSFLRERTWSYNTSYKQSIWISTAQSAGMAAAMPVLGLVEQKLQPRFCALIGGWIFSAGVLLTYFTVKHSLGLTILTYGVIHGIGKGMAYPAAVKCGIMWFPERKGLVTGLTIAGIGGGTFIFNEVITHFINPENFRPEVEVANDLYFGQDTLLDRVPYGFLLLGGVYASVQLVCVLIIGEPKKPEAKKNEDEETELNLKAEENDEQLENDKEIQLVEEKINFTPLEVLKTKVFYVLWVIFVLVPMGIFFVSNFYKTFSQRFIKDDHFLSLAASISSVANALGRPFWGAVGDRIGYRETIVTVCSIFGTAAATFTLCEYGGKVMLMIWMILIYGTFSGFYAVMPTLMVSLFGQKYYSTNYGLLFNAIIVAQVVGAVLASKLRDSIGWKGILYIGAGAVLFSLVLSTAMLIHHRRQLRKLKK